MIIMILIFWLRGNAGNSRELRTNVDIRVRVTIFGD